MPYVKLELYFCLVYGTLPKKEIKHCLKELFEVHKKKKKDQNEPCYDTSFFL